MLPPLPLAAVSLELLLLLLVPLLLLIVTQENARISTQLWRPASWAVPSQRVRHRIASTTLQHTIKDARAMPIFRNLLCTESTAGGVVTKCGLACGFLGQRSQHVEPRARDHKEVDMTCLHDY